jgi:hypothetical protein
MEVGKMPAQSKTKQSRGLTAAGLIAVTAATLLMMAWAIFPTAAFATVLWDGNGVVDGNFKLERCDDLNTPYIFWVFTGDPAPGESVVHLTVNNGAPISMVQQGKGSWHATSPFFDLNTVTASVDGVDGTLTISHGCPGETTTTTTTTTPPEKGRIVIEKQTVPNGDPATFGFTGEITTTLGDGQESGKDVDPGTYTVSETALAGWTLTDITCNDNNSTDAGNTATFNVEAGETVRCVFTNTKDQTTTTTPGGGGGGGGGGTTTTPPPAPTTTPIVAPTTVTNTSTTATDEVLPTTVRPGKLAFTGIEDVVPIGALALTLMTTGSGLLWAGSRRRRHDGSEDED